jgi:hypothetical protein
VNHKGEPVANAEVLLLGPERIMVEANRKTWFAIEGDKSASPPSTRTNRRGEFSIQRQKTKADRLAVIADDPLFWVVSRKSLARGEDIEIKLPPSGSLAINCNLPGKAAKQPVMIVLRTFDGVEWDTDALRFHCGEVAVPNPGETVFEHLPPAVYSVERNEEVRTGSSSVSMNLATRPVTVVPAGQAVAGGVGAGFSRTAWLSFGGSVATNLWPSAPSPAASAPAVRSTTSPIFNLDVAIALIPPRAIATASAETAPPAGAVPELKATAARAAAANTDADTAAEAACCDSPAVRSAAGSSMPRRVRRARSSFSPCPRRRSSVRNDQPNCRAA